MLDGPAGATPSSCGLRRRRGRPLLRPRLPRRPAGRLQPHELLYAAVEAGRHLALRVVDVFEVDAAADVGGVTVQLAVMRLLSLAARLATL